jgi:uncharacterized membrane protein YbhN (UPF0104 family)
VSEPPSVPEREVTAEQVSLGRRLRQPRTIISILVPLVVIVVFVGLNRDQLERVPELILAANPLLVLAAFAVYYAGFPLRGYRWALLLRGTGFHCPTSWAMSTGPTSSRSTAWPPSRAPSGPSSSSGSWTSSRS